MTSEVPEEIEEKLNDLEGQVRALHNAREYLLEQVEELKEENEQLRQDLEEVEQTAATAYGLAGETSDGARADGGPSDQKRAEWLSRNEVVRRAVTGNQRGGAVTATEVKSMARPETDLFNKQVTRAWSTLAQKWPELEYERRNDKLNRIRVDADNLSDELVRVVERDLDRDNLLEELEKKRQRKARA
jgi:TolA-binding protein